jgi:cobalt/nickel transport system permease protein
MTAVIIVQALFLADGGVVALGLNIFNLAIVGVSSAYIIYTSLMKLFLFKHGRWLAVAIGAWSSVMLSALCFSLQSSIFGSVELSRIIPAVLSSHAVVGLAEGLFTILLINILSKTLPQN